VFVISVDGAYARTSSTLTDANVIINWMMKLLAALIRLCYFLVVAVVVVERTTVTATVAVKKR
jgi:hypothetical protein